MTQQAYIKQTLEPHVTFTKANPELVLAFEERDSGHEPETALS